MDKRGPSLTDDDMPRISEAGIVACLDEAEADEAAGRVTDGGELIRELRRKAHELQAKITRRRA